MTSWFEDAFNGAGSTRKLRSAIEPGSGSRKTWSKTRIVKKELGVISKRKVSRFDSLLARWFPLSRFKSRLIATVPFATSIRSKVPVCPCRSSDGDVGAEFPELPLKSKKRGRVR